LTSLPFLQYGLTSLNVLKAGLDMLTPQWLVSLYQYRTRRRFSSVTRVSRPTHTSPSSCRARGDRSCFFARRRGYAPSPALTVRGKRGWSV